jgi:hypothetical protein
MLKKVEQFMSAMLMHTNHVIRECTSSIEHFCITLKLMGENAFKEKCMQSANAWF